MAITRTRKMIGSNDRGIALTVLTDRKFKTDSFAVRFITELTEENAAANAAVAFMIEDTCAAYPDITAFNKRLLQLYGASVRGGIERYAHSQVITIAATSVGSRFALDGEDISALVLELLCGCIFDPVTENGSFPEKQFELKKQELIDDIDADINDKRSYALKQSGRIIYRNEPAGIAVKGERAAAEKLSSETVWQAYKALLRSARIEITFVGAELSEKCEKVLEEKFGSLERENIHIPQTKRSPVKESPEYVTERLDVLQSKMVMAYKTDMTNMPVRMTFVALFGGLPISLLFTNVREKLSLCYYCAASFAKKTGVMYIDSGVENKNIIPAREEIQNQLEMAAKGEFSDELLSQAKLSLRCALMSVDDSPKAVSDWYFGYDMETGSEKYAPDELSSLVEKVTKEQVMEFAASFKLDTVYVLTGKEN